MKFRLRKKNKVNEARLQEKEANEQVGNKERKLLITDALFLLATYLVHPR